MAKEKRCKPAQLALTWVMARGEDVVPIPGTKRRKYLEENAGALTVLLSSDDLARIDAIAPQGVAAGTRYPEAHMGRVNLQPVRVGRSLQVRLWYEKCTQAYLMIDQHFYW